MPAFDLDTEIANQQLKLPANLSHTLDQLGLRQIHPKSTKKVETFFSSDRIYLPKGAIGHLSTKLVSGLAALFFI